jgi:hypothetical protein
MAVDNSRWPPRVRQFQEVLASAVESFEGRAFDYRRSACDQLRERLLELQLPGQLEVLMVVTNELTERECIDICLSRQPELN